MKNKIPAWWGPPSIGWVRLWWASCNPIRETYMRCIIFWDKIRCEYYWKKLDRKWKRKRMKENEKASQEASKADSD